MILLFFNSKYYEVYKVGCEASMATLKLKGCGVSPSINISAENGILDVGNALVGDCISTTLKVPDFALFLQSLAFRRIDSVSLKAVTLNMGSIEPRGVNESGSGARLFRMICDVTLCWAIIGCS